MLYVYQLPWLHSVPNIAHYACVLPCHHVMALVPGLNIGVGLLLLILVWVAAVLATLALAAVPKAR